MDQKFWAPDEFHGILFNRYTMFERNTALHQSTTIKHFQLGIINISYLVYYYILGQIIHPLRIITITFYDKYLILKY